MYVAFLCAAVVFIAMAAEGGGAYPTQIPPGTEVEGEKDTDDRPFLHKTAHILSFGLLFQRKRRNYAAEELSTYQGGQTQRAHSQSFRSSCLLISDTN